MKNPSAINDNEPITRREYELGQEKIATEMKKMQENMEEMQENMEEIKENMQEIKEMLRKLIR